MIRQASAGLLLWPGAGKTSCVYAAIKLLQRKGFVRRILVIAPLKPCYLVWPQEADKWDEFRDFKINILHGPDKNVAPGFDIDVINPEGLDWLVRQRFTKWPWDMLVIDESSKFKSPRTQRFKTLKSILGKFKRRYILTGTPAPNGLLDLWSQIYVLDGGDALGKYISHYRMRYFIPGGYGGYEWILRDDAAPEIYEKIRPLVLRPDDTEYRKSLPPLVQVDMKIDLPKKARQAYNSLEDDLVLSLSKGDVTAVNAAVATMKLRQIANGAVYADEERREPRTDRKVLDIHDAKIEAVKDLVAELEGQPAFIAYEFQHELTRLKKALGNPPYLAGGVKPKDAIEIAERWNAGDLPVLLVQPQSVAHGLNLQGAGRAIIWYGLTWNLEDYTQLIQRIWRQGKVGQLFNYRLIAKGTVDEDVVAALAKKDRVQGALLDALKSRAAKRR